MLSEPFEFLIWYYSNIPNIIGEYTKDSNIITSNIIQVTTEVYDNFSFLESSNAHNILIKAKNSLIMTKEKTKNIYDNCNKEYKEFEESYKAKNSIFNFDEFTKKYDEITKILQSIKEKIINTYFQKY